MKLRRAARARKFRIEFREILVWDNPPRAAYVVCTGRGLAWLAVELAYMGKWALLIAAP
jgi:hypothetical protein